MLVTDTTLTPGVVEFVGAGGAEAGLLIAEGMYASEEDKPKVGKRLYEGGGGLQL